MADRELELGATATPAKSRTRRVHFASFLQRRVPTHSPGRSASFGNWGNERTPLLRSEPFLRRRIVDTFEDDDDTRATCTPMDTFVTLLILLGILGVCVAAVFFGVGKHMIRPRQEEADNPRGAPHYNGSRNMAYLVRGNRGAVASEDKICSNLGLDVLKDGGNAVDAAILANLCIGTVRMSASGIGGGGFAIVRIPGKNGTNSTAFTIDFRETAPGLANKTMYGSNPVLPKIGGLAVAVPGELRGLEAMHSKWGRLPWKRLVEPVAVLAAGWDVSAELSYRLQKHGSWIPHDPDWGPTFAPNGKLLEEGEPISRPEYSRTLHSVAEHGARAFYEGPISESIVAKVKSKGGIISLDDVRNYKSIVQQALEGSYLGRRIYTTNAPTSGPIVLHILNILEHYDLIGEGRTPLNIHRLVEAMKFGFAARTRLADPAFLKDNYDLASIPTKGYADLVWANITDDHAHPPSYYNPMYDVMEDHGTTHTSVVDSEGMAVGITSTLNLPFGSHVLDTQTGVILNSEMDDFATYRTPNAYGLYPSPYNYPQPGKRPMSSIAPVVIESPDGELHLVAGGSGGSLIFGSVVQVILGLDWGLDISAAIERPRVHNQLFPLFTLIESSMNREDIVDLAARGHVTLVRDINLSSAAVQAVHISQNGTYFAASDSRKYGVAAAY